MLASSPWVEPTKSIAEAVALSSASFEPVRARFAAATVASETLLVAFRVEFRTLEVELVILSEADLRRSRDGGVASSTNSLDASLIWDAADLVVRNASCDDSRAR